MLLASGRTGWFQKQFCRPLRDANTCFEALCDFDGNIYRDDGFIVIKGMALVELKHPVEDSVWTFGAVIRRRFVRFPTAYFGAVSLENLYR